MRFPSVLGLCAPVLVPGLGVGGRGGLCEERPVSAPYQTQLVPDGSNAPPQGTAEPLSQDGGTSGKTYLRKGKMVQSSVRNEEKICEAALKMPR